MPPKLLGFFVGLIPVLFISSFTWASHISAPSGHLNDFAGVLTAVQKSALESKLTDYQTKTTNEIAVAFVKNLNGGEINDFAVRVFEEWKIGKKGRDNGVLFLAAVEDRKIRIEVGYGLEGSLTDGRAGEIIRGQIAPKFKQNDYFSGTDSGLSAIMASLDGNYTSTGANNGPTEKIWNFFTGFISIFGELGIILTLLLIVTPLVYLGSFLARTKSIWMGGLIGSGAGLIFGLISGLVLVTAALVIILGVLGLFLDWLLSRNYQKLKDSGKPTNWWNSGGGFWMGGGSGGGDNGFGGFGGGGSGGGGSSGSW